MIVTCPHCREEFDTPRPASGEALTCPACGHDFVDTQPTLSEMTIRSPSTDIEPGSQIAGFLIEEKIGVGAMGQVYRARQLSLDRIVAFKVLPRAFADHPLFVTRFHEESTALSAMNHPNIVTIIERGNVGDTYFFVMEHIDGPALVQVMREPLDCNEFLNVAKGTAAALEYAHAHGIVHRDIKPANIMLNSQGVLKVADFGLGGLMAQTNLDEGDDKPRINTMGTPAYMSPEQRRNALAVDGRSDIYSLGVVLYELLARQKPRLPLTRLPSEVSEAADPRLDHIVARCLQERPEERYQTAGELLADLALFEQEYALAPACPGCGTVSPVRSQSCVRCGRDLAQFFDICPDCNRKNRIEVRRCLACGMDLQGGRTIISQRVTMMLENADSMRLTRDFDGALEVLHEVKGIAGKAFEEHRERAKALEQRTVAERQRAAHEAYERAQQLVNDRQFAKAIELLRSIPPDIRDTAKAVANARRLQAQFVAQKKSAALINLLLIVLGLILVIVTLIVAFL